MTTTLAPALHRDREAVSVRDHALDVLKGAAIIGVLIIHADFTRFDPPTRATVGWLGWLFQWCVPAFFFAAGRLARHPTAPKAAARYVWARAKRLLVPYVAFTALYKLTLLANLARGTGEWQWCWAGGPQLYFLPYLSSVAAMAGVVVVLARGRSVGLVVAVGLAVATAWLAQPTTATHGPHLALVGLYTGNYFAGLARAGWGIGAAAVLAAGVAATAVHAGNPQLLAAGMPPLAYGALRLSVGARSAALAGWLGRWSGAVYVWHTPLLMPAASIAAVRVVGPGPAALVIVLAAGVLGSVGLGYLAIHLSVLRPFRI